MQWWDYFESPGVTGRVWGFYPLKNGPCRAGSPHLSLPPFDLPELQKFHQDLIWYH